MDENRTVPQEPRSEELLRDRLLLYVRALRVPPREGLKLILKTMDELLPSGTRGTLPTPAEDCGEDSGTKTGTKIDMKIDMETAMETLRTLCAERDLLPDADALPCPVPPYNRGSMPPAKISMTRGGFSLRNLFLKGLFLRGLIGRLRRAKEGQTR